MDRRLLELADLIFHWGITADQYHLSRIRGLIALVNFSYTILFLIASK